MNQWRKDIVSWRCGDTLYLSVPFTWLRNDACRIALQHKGPVFAGGPAIALGGCDGWAEYQGETPFDVLAFHNPCATKTTRGCPHRCAFCAVPETEGGFRELDTWKPAPVVCDNNILAASRRHFERVIDSLRPFRHVDFNQGLDVCFFTRWHADQIGRLNSAKVRFAFDRMNAESRVVDAIAIARSAGLKDLGVYVLIGFNDTPDEAIYRLEKVREWGIRPNPMRYQPLNVIEKNSYVAPGWAEIELRRMMQYYSRLRWHEHISFSDFHRASYEQDLLSEVDV